MSFVKHPSVLFVNNLNSAVELCDMVDHYAISLTLINLLDKIEENKSSSLIGGTNFIVVVITT
jgi:hypothetical protein